MNFRLLIAGFAIAALAWSQTSFDVISIKPSEPSPDGRLRGGETKTPLGGWWSSTNITVKRLIQQAYGVNDSQVLKGPAWIETQEYNIQARAGTPDRLTPDQSRVLLQALLTDRFQLRVHREPTDLPGYSLVVDKNGPKLKVATGSVPTSLRVGGDGIAVAQSVSMARLVKLLGSQVNAAIVDKTGLEGDFDFNLKMNWTAAEREPLTPGDVMGPSPVFQAVQQLGLRLVAQKAPGEVIVIDRVAKPSEN